MISSIVQLFIGIPSTKKDKQFNHNKKLAKKWFKCRRWFKWNNNACLQWGNEPTMDDVNMEMDHVINLTTWHSHGENCTSNMCNLQFQALEYTSIKIFTCLDFF